MADWSEMKDTKIRLNNWQSGTEKVCIWQGIPMGKELGREKIEVKGNFVLTSIFIQKKRKSLTFERD